LGHSHMDHNAGGVRAHALRWRPCVVMARHAYSPVKGQRTERTRWEGRTDEALSLAPWVEEEKNPQCEQNEAVFTCCTAPSRCTALHESIPTFTAVSSRRNN